MWRSKQNKAGKEKKSRKECSWSDHCCGQLENKPVERSLENGAECVSKLFLHRRERFSPVHLCLRVASRGVSSSAPLLTIFPGCCLFSQELGRIFQHAQEMVTTAKDKITGKWRECGLWHRKHQLYLVYNKLHFMSHFRISWSSYFHIILLSFHFFHLLKWNLLERYDSRHSTLNP